MGMAALPYHHVQRRSLFARLFIAEVGDVFLGKYTFRMVALPSNRKGITNAETDQCGVQLRN